MTTDALDVIRRIRASASVAAPQPGTVCELCGEPISDEHGHLVDLEQRNVLCSCRGCYLLFTPEGSGGARFRAVPDNYRSLPGVRLSPVLWDSLQIPVSVAFLFYNSTLERVAAFYPSPAGATESLLPLEAWDEVVAADPELGALNPDVEALLVRVDPGTNEAECHLVPIDACYELVGQFRRLWKGFDGGAEVHAALDAFFSRVRDRSERS